MLRGLHLVQGRALVVTSPSDKRAGSSAEAYLRTLPPGSATVVAPDALDQAQGNVGAVAVFCSDVGLYFEFDYTLLQRCLEKLRPGGVVLARLGGLRDDAQVAGLETVGLFAGGVESRVGKVSRSSKSGTGLMAEFSCLKPSWAAGSTAQLPGSGAVELINEDELLGDVPKPMGKGKSDCSSQPKACANCTCGRKELEDKHGAEEAKTRLQQGKERSACGSCYLGDAFRCESCPYRGLPAFKAGTKVELSAGETEGSGQLAMRMEVGDEALRTESGKLLVSVA